MAAERGLASAPTTFEDLFHGVAPGGQQRQAEEFAECLRATDVLGAPASAGLDRRSGATAHPAWRAWSTPGGDLRPAFRPLAP